MGGVVGGALGLALIGVLLYYVALRQSSYARVAQGRSVGPPKSAVIRRTHTRREPGDTDRSMSLLSTYTMPVYVRVDRACDNGILS